MDSIITTVIPACIAMIVTPIILSKLVNGCLDYQIPSKAMWDNEHFTAQYPPVLIRFFAGCTLFFTAMLALLFHLEDERTTLIWGCAIFGVPLSLSLLLWYCAGRWRVRVDGTKITMWRPFRRKREYSIDQIKGYMKCENGFKILDVNGKTICLETVLVGPPLSSYFSAHGKILPPEKKKGRH